MHTMKVYYRPDNYPDWIPWRTFTQEFDLIGKAQALDSGGVPTARAGFIPRLSFGKPPNKCDRTTLRNTRRGFDFQVRLVWTGHLKLERFRLHGQRLVERSRAQNITRAT